MKPNRPLDHDDFDEPEPTSTVWIIVLGGLVILAMLGVFVSSMRMLGVF